MGRRSCPGRRTARRWRRSLGAAAWGDIGAQDPGKLGNVLLILRSSWFSHSGRWKAVSGWGQAVTAGVAVFFLVQGCAWYYHNVLIDRRVLQRREA